MLRHGLTRLAIVVASFALTACAGGSSAPPAPVHSAESGEPTLNQVAGYSYSDVPDSGQTSLAAEVAKVNAKVPGYVAASSIHVVTKDSDPRPSFVLVLEQVDSNFSSLPGFDSTCFDDMASGLRKGGSLKGFKIESRSGVLLAFGIDTKIANDGNVVFEWVHDGIVVKVVGVAESPADDFVTAYLAQDGR